LLLFPSTQFLYLLDEELGVRGRAQEGGGSFIYMCVDTSKSEMNHRLIVKHHTTPHHRYAAPTRGRRKPREARQR